MFKAIKAWWRKWNDRPDPATKDLPITNINSCKTTPPLPCKYDSTPYGHYDHDFLVWAFGEIPNDKSSLYYINAWNNRHGSVHNLSDDCDLGLTIPVLLSHWYDHLRSLAKVSK